MTKASLLLVVGEAFDEAQKSLILDRIVEELNGWDDLSSGCNLEKELENLVAAKSSSTRDDNSVAAINHEAESLSTSILFNPERKQLYENLQNFLLSDSDYHHLVYVGLTLAGSGSWILRDDVFTFRDFARVLKDMDSVGAGRDGKCFSLTVGLLCEWDWSRNNLSKLSSLGVKLSGEKVSKKHAFNSFRSYLSRLTAMTDVKDLLKTSNTVGTINFSAPTLYIFPGGNGSSSLFGVRGFTALVDGGYGRKPCFWDFSRHIQQIDMMLLTHLGVNNILGMQSFLERKLETGLPEVGSVFFNCPEKFRKSAGDNGLKLNLFQTGATFAETLNAAGLSPQSCYSLQPTHPITLYNKVGFGSVDMYVLNPIQNTEEMRSFLNQWSQRTESECFSSHSGIPLSNCLSVSVLLVWKPFAPNGKIVRILFAGGSPQSKIFEGLDRLKNVSLFERAYCLQNDLNDKSPNGVGKSGRIVQSQPVNSKQATSKVNVDAEVSKAKPVPESKDLVASKAKPDTKETAPSKSTPASRPSKVDVKSPEKTVTNSTPATNESKPITKTTSPQQTKAMSPQQTKTTTPQQTKTTAPQQTKTTSPQKATRDVKAKPSENLAAAKKPISKTNDTESTSKNRASKPTEAGKQTKPPTKRPEVLEPSKPTLHKSKEEKKEEKPTKPEVIKQTKTAETGKAHAAVKQVKSAKEPEKKSKQLETADKKNRQEKKDSEKQVKTPIASVAAPPITETAKQFHVEESIGSEPASVEEVTQSDVQSEHSESFTTQSTSETLKQFDIDESAGRKLDEPAEGFSKESASTEEVINSDILPKHSEDFTIQSASEDVNHLDVDESVKEITDAKESFDKESASTLEVINSDILPEHSEGFTMQSTAEDLNQLNIDDSVGKELPVDHENGDKESALAEEVTNSDILPEHSEDFTIQSTTKDLNEFHIEESVAKELTEDEENFDKEQASNDEVIESDTLPEHSEGFTIQSPTEAVNQFHIDDSIVKELIEPEESFNEEPASTEEVTDSDILPAHSEDVAIQSPTKDVNQIDLDEEIAVKQVAEAEESFNEKSATTEEVTTSDILRQHSEDFAIRSTTEAVNQFHIEEDIQEPSEAAESFDKESPTTEPVTNSNILSEHSEGFSTQSVTEAVNQFEEDFVKEPSEAEGSFDKDSISSEEVTNADVLPEHSEDFIIPTTSETVGQFPTEKKFGTELTETEQSINKESVAVEEVTNSNILPEHSDIEQLIVYSKVRIVEDTLVGDESVPKVQEYDLPSPEDVAQMSQEEEDSYVEELPTEAELYEALPSADDEHQNQVIPGQIEDGEDLIQQKIVEEIETDYHHESVCEEEIQREKKHELHDFRDDLQLKDDEASSEEEKEVYSDKNTIVDSSKHEEYSQFALNSKNEDSEDDAVEEGTDAVNIRNQGQEDGFDHEDLLDDKDVQNVDTVCATYGQKDLLDNEDIQDIDNISADDKKEVFDHEYHRNFTDEENYKDVQVHDNQTHNEQEFQDKSLTEDFDRDFQAHDSPTHNDEQEILGHHEKCLTEDFDKHFLDQDNSVPEDDQEILGHHDKSLTEDFEKDFPVHDIPTHKDEQEIEGHYDKSLPEDFDKNSQDNDSIADNDDQTFEVLDNSKTQETPDSSDLKELGLDNKSDLLEGENASELHDDLIEPEAADVKPQESDRLVKIENGCLSDEDSSAHSLEKEDEDDEKDDLDAVPEEEEIEDEGDAEGDEGSRSKPVEKFLPGAQSEVFAVCEASKEEEIVGVSNHHVIPEDSRASDNEDDLLQYTLKKDEACENLAALCLESKEIISTSEDILQKSDASTGSAVPDLVAPCGDALGLNSKHFPSDLFETEKHTEQDIFAKKPMDYDDVPYSSVPQDSLIEVLHSESSDLHPGRLPDVLDLENSDKSISKGSEWEKEFLFGVADKGNNELSEISGYNKEQDFGIDFPKSFEEGTLSEASELIASNEECVKSGVLVTERTKELEEVKTQFDGLFEKIFADDKTSVATSNGKLNLGFDDGANLSVENDRSSDACLAVDLVDTLNEKSAEDSGESDLEGAQEPFDQHQEEGFGGEKEDYKMDEGFEDEQSGDLLELEPLQQPEFLPFAAVRSKQGFSADEDETSELRPDLLTDGKNSQNPFYDPDFDGSNGKCDDQVAELPVSEREDETESIPEHSDAEELNEFIRAEMSTEAAMCLIPSNDNDGIGRGPNEYRSTSEFSDEGNELLELEQQQQQQQSTQNSRLSSFWSYDNAPSQEIAPGTGAADNVLFGEETNDVEKDINENLDILNSTDGANNTEAVSTRNSVSEEIQSIPTVHDEVTGHESDCEVDPVMSWGQPMGLPAPTQDGNRGRPRAKPAGDAANLSLPVGAGDKSSTTKKTNDARRSVAPKLIANSQTETKESMSSAKDSKAAASKKPVATSGTPKAKKPTTTAIAASKSTTVSTTAAVSKSATAAPAAVSKSAPTAAVSKSVPTSAPAAVSKLASAAAPTAPAVLKSKPLKPVIPFYVDLTYIPGNGDPSSVDVDFFRRVRAQYYVLSALEPDPRILSCLVEGKQTWENKDLAVEVIPTYDSEALHRWRHDNFKLLEDLKITILPAANKCTIKLQADKDDGCCAFRVEF